MSCENEVVDLSDPGGRVTRRYGTLIPHFDNISMETTYLGPEEDTTVPRGVSSNGIYPFHYFYKLLQRFLIRIQQIAKGTGEEFSTDQRRDPLAHGINSMARLICISFCVLFLIHSAGTQTAHRFFA